MDTVQEMFSIMSKKSQSPPLIYHVDNPIVKMFEKTTELHVNAIHPDM